ncbi:MAG: peptide chain release factor N(5)-glutamine methyltransferase [Pseudomonadota bacterium]
MQQSHTVKELLAQSAALGIPVTECLGLAAKVLGCNRSAVWAFPEKTVSDAHYQELISQFQQRAQGVPFAYLLGEQEFWSLSFKVSPDVLIPRPETELLVEAVLARLGDRQCTVLELGTGSGCISAALSIERSNWQLVAVDQSATALALAEENAARLGCANITFCQSDWYTALVPSVTFDAIVSNPPYLGQDDPYLGTDIRYEPHAALVSGQTGLEAYEAIIAGAKGFLKPGGLLMFEHGYTQVEELSRMLEAQGFCIVESRRDLQGHPRVLVARS